MAHPYEVPGRLSSLGLSAGQSVSSLYRLMAQQTGEKFDNLSVPELYAAQFSHEILVESDGLPLMEK
jgi:hypothetical protein